MMKVASIAALAALMASSAFAAGSFYIAHAPNSKSCSIVETKPDGKTMLQVGNAHKSKALAESAMKATAACTH